MKRFLGFILLVAILVGCNKAAPKPTIILDSSWRRDSAACKGSASQQCLAYSEEGQFEDEFASAFASDASCNGIALVRLDDLNEVTPEKGNAIRQPAWWFSILYNYNLGGGEHGWYMNHTPDSAHKDYALCRHRHNAAFLIMPN